MMIREMIKIPCPVVGVRIVYVGGGKPVELRSLYGERVFLNRLVKLIGILRTKAGLSELHTQGLYSHRKTRRGRNLSLHAYGRAIDLAGFVVHDRWTLNVRRDWNNPHAEAFWNLLRGAIEAVSFGEEIELITPATDPRDHADHIHWGLRLPR